MAFYEWRKFNFFEVRKDIDEGKVAEVLQDATIQVCTAGHSHAIIGDDKGQVHIFSRSWKATSFKTYERAIFLAVQLKHEPYLITVGEDETGIKCTIKVWDWSRRDAHGRFACLRLTKLSRMRSTPTCLTVHDNKNLMAIGFDDGNVILFKGDVTRQRSSKELELRNGQNDPTPITGLAFKGTSHLFVSSRSSVMVFDISGGSGKERGTSLDEEASGCRADCAVLVHDQQFVVARNDAIYCYTTDGRGPCYALEGVKKRVDWFRSYLVAVSKQGDPSESDGDRTTILDIQNKFIVFSMAFDNIKTILTEWGGFYVITEDKHVHHLDEKDLQSKLSLLFKKNLYDVAIRIADGQKYDSERLIDIYTQYGDHLFQKGDPKGAVEQYVKTIGRLETSYVIRKYLEFRHLEPLTQYLQELHKMGLATEDHTTLLLTCFVKLDQHDHHGKLKEFINAKDRVIDFDVEIAIKVCRQVSSDDALHLAKKHLRHDWYLRILTEDKKDYASALSYIAELEFDDANTYMNRYGNILMLHMPKETTQFLKLLCIDYKAKNKPLVDDAMMAGVISRNRIERARPEDYLHLFLNNSELLVEFIEHLIKCESNWSSLIYNTLIEHYLHVWSELQDKPTLKKSCEENVVKLLQNPDANYDKDQTLIVCLMSNFTPGVLYLYEEYRLYRQILRYHIAQKDMDSAMDCCRKFGAQEPHLWVEMLWCPPPPQHLAEVLDVIANLRLLSPLLVIDCLANSTFCTLADIRKYLMNILMNEEDISTRECVQGEKLRGEAKQGRTDLCNASIKPLICQASRCAACSRPLELPSRHFLCTHSYHQHCIQSFSENEDECPTCEPNNRKLLEVLRNQGTSASTTESFHAQLEKSHDGFSVVADYFGRGIFNKLTVITSEDVQYREDVLLNDNLPKEIKPHMPDNYNIPKTEGRLRLEEGKSKLMNLENQKVLTPKSAVLQSTPEARVRLSEMKKPEITTNSKQIDSKSTKTYQNDRLENESSKNSLTSPMNKKPMHSNVDNISIGSNTSSKKDKPSSLKGVSNPFEDDTEDTQGLSSGLSCEDNKNPFDDASNPKNPFADSDDDDSESKRDTFKNSGNPFE